MEAYQADVTLYREFGVSKSEIRVCFFPIRRSLGMRYKLMTGIFSYTPMFLIGIGFTRTSIPRPIKFFNSTEIPDWTTNKMPMRVTIIQQNRFFLTDIRIYIVSTRKLHDLSKRISADRKWLLFFGCNPNSFNLFIYFSHCIRCDLATKLSIELISTLLGLASFSFFLLHEEIISLSCDNQLNSIDYTA